MLIAEQLMLLLLDPERGELDVRYDATDPDRLGAAALLLDLADQRNLGHRNGYIAYHPRFPQRPSAARHAPAKRSRPRDPACRSARRSI